MKCYSRFYLVGMFRNKKKIVMAIFSYFLVVELKIKKNNILKDGRHNYSFILDSICILLIRKNKVNLISKYKKIN